MATIGLDLQVTTEAITSPVVIHRIVEITRVVELLRTEEAIIITITSLVTSPITGTSQMTVVV
nr:hypothetical 6.7K protein - porcine epidemic diarrhea virus (isolate Belgian CV777) [Porcine epidemic diarrhea virus]